MDIIRAKIYPDVANIVYDYLTISKEDVSMKFFLVMLQLRQKRFFFQEFYCQICHDDLKCICDASLAVAMQSYHKDTNFRDFIETYRDVLCEIDKKLID